MSYKYVMAGGLHRDIIVIGTSAGGVSALPKVLSALPSDLPASVVIVQHLAAESNLVEVLQPSTRLAVRWAEQGSKLDHGAVYVAPPGTHMLAVDGHLRLDAGPRENHVRPSIDRTFRSIAALHGPRAIGVILTGLLDDGVVGLAALRDSGGHAIVEDPQSADFGELPRNAIARAGADAVAPLAGIPGALMAALAQTVEPREAPSNILLEAELDRAIASPDTLDRLGTRVTMPCPECGGPQWRIEAGAAHHRCYLGHATSHGASLEYTREEVTRAMWVAARALHDREHLFEELASESEAARNKIAAAAYVERAADARRSANDLLSLLENWTLDGPNRYSR